MTDRLDCPDCDGSGEERIGPLRLVCRFCRGAGYVGDDNEPGEERPCECDGEPLPVWDQVGVEALPGCRMCLGTGRVINLGGGVGGGVATSMVESPCPACAAEG